MFEPRVIYACNHYVVENFNEAASLAVSSGEIIEDELYRRKDILFPNSSFDKDIFSHSIKSAHWLIHPR